jgi:short-subunit dehydrogenase
VKSVIIIGATSAIAGACARLWAARGSSFFLVGRDAEKLDALSHDLRVRGASAAHPFVMDANDVAAHAAMVAAAVQALGRLDIVLIAHGTLPDQPVCEADTATAVREFMSNGLSAIALLTVLANELERQRSGAIGVITSVAGDRGRPSNYLYGSAKAAVSVFSDGLRARLFKAGVSLTDIRPGFVATPMTQGLALPALLVARPETVAKRIVTGIERQRDVLYAPAFWSVVMWGIRSIPRAVFHRMHL